MEEKKKMINGGDVLIKCLLQENVRYMFGVPGGQILNLYDAVYRWGKEKGITTVMFRHEQAAAHAADAYTRITNTPGVCFGTVGPGATNLLPGVGAAWSDNIPVIAIIPQVNSKYEDTLTLQGNLDQITMFKPITKYQRSIREIEKIPEAVQKAFREAISGRPQPVLLEIFEDAFLAEIEEDKIPIFSPDRYRAFNKPTIDNEMIKQSLDLLLKAEKPLIISGGGVSRAEAWNELTEFAEYLQIPVVTTVMGIGTISCNSKCFMSSTIIGPVLPFVPQCDVILALGCKFSFTVGHGFEPFWKNSQKLIQVDIDASIIGRHKPVTLGILGDCRQFLKQILNEVKRTERVERGDWLENLITAKDKYFKKYFKKGLEDSIPIHPKRLVKEVFEFLDEDAILVVDGGDITIFVHEQIGINKPRAPLSHLVSVCMGHLGTAIPYSIGAKLAKPDKQVIAIAGDGSIMMNIQELETAVRLGLKNLIYVIANNSAWGMIKSGQKLFMGKRYIDVDFPLFDFAKCAEGFGAYGQVVVDPNEIKSALERAKNSNKPAVIDVRTQFETPEGTKLMGAMGVL